MSKFVYAFGGSSVEGNANMRDLLGGKGANLAEMSSIGLPVPPGFTITTAVCRQYTQDKKNFPDGLKAEVNLALGNIEKIIGKKFGVVDNPLLVSVRSGARASMPGMMDTVLNLGLNDETVRGLVDASGDERFAYDTYRRFIQMYGDVVLGVEHYNFEEIITEYKEDHELVLDTDVNAADWKAITAKFLELVDSLLGKKFPQDPYEQLWGAIRAVFNSWANERARVYRKLHHIPEEWGTAVNIQSMVFGNMGNDSATGVCFTRNPSSGENSFYGEFLVNAQGEDVVAGIRTPQPLTILEKEKNRSVLPAMEEAMPSIFAKLCEIRKQLEDHYTDMQDIEFTVEQGKLWMLQTRAGKRTATAALKIAIDMEKEGLISREEAICRVDPVKLDQLLHPTLDPGATRNVVAKGLPASPGAASGTVCFSSMEAEEIAEKGGKVILVRVETSPEDIGGMHAAQGILTTRGGMTSHAAVVARGMGRPCVAGAGDVRVDYHQQLLTAGGQTIKSGEVITIDGSRGDVMSGAVDTILPELTGDFGVFMDWVDEFRTMGVRANAETPDDATTAVNFGAEGIGLCRTEHMFFDPVRIVNMREMILSSDEAGRRVALAKMLPFQREDFKKLFAIMHGLPVTIRLLDPPLHEFLPGKDEELHEVANAAGTEFDEVRARVAALHETNPMLGLRGCRLAIMYPEIYEMQCRAIFEAAAEVSEETGDSVMTEIMIPLVASKQEFEILRTLVSAIAAEVEEEKKASLDYLIGTMIELPRAALRAGEIAETAEFFSFGTNDLTQTTFGLSRDDSGTFLDPYIENGIFINDPFVTIDQDGVGELVKIAIDRGREVREKLKLGICGEHGGDPESIKFCQLVGLDYVSCSPYRVPVARLACAQASINKQKIIAKV